MHSAGLLKMHGIAGAARTAADDESEVALVNGPPTDAPLASSANGAPLPVIRNRRHGPGPASQFTHAILEISQTVTATPCSTATWFEPSL